MTRIDLPGYKLLEFIFQFPHIIKNDLGFVLGVLVGWIELLAAEAFLKPSENEAERQRSEEVASDAELTVEQQDATCQVLADIYATEKPGEIPEGTTTEEFTELIDEALANCLNGLVPILTEEQLKVYEGQAEGFRRLVNTLIGVTSE